MDLAELNFKANTKELLDAVDTIDKVTNAVKRMNDAQSKSSSSDQSSTHKIIKDGHKAVESTDKVTHALEKQSEKMRILRNEVVTVSDGFVQLGDGFTNSQAGMLANLKLLGATEEQMKALSASFREYNRITGVNTFDKSAAGLEKLKKSIAEIGNVNKLAKEGLSLTRNQLIDLNRDIERVTQAFASSNNQVKISGQVYSNLDEAIKRLKSDFINLASSVNEFEKEAKDAEIAAKKIASDKAAAESAGMRMNDDAVQLFIKNEQRKQATLKNTIRLQEESALKQRLMQEKYTSGESSRIITLVRGGVSEDAAKQEISAAREAAKATHDATLARQKANKVIHDNAKANDYLTMTEKRLDEQIKAATNIRQKYTDQLVKIKEALRQSGLSAEQAAAKFAILEAKVNAVAFKEKERDIRNLGRAISVQMGDVGISLASGMNPLLVMIQQGDQIRGAIQQANVSGEQLNKTMAAAAGQIASSFILTGKAIGGFFVSSILVAGKTLNTFVAELAGAGTAVKKLDEWMISTKNSTSIVTISLRALITGFTILTGILTGGAIVAIGAFVIGLIQVIKEQDALARSLALTGGSLGLTMDRAYDYANSLNSVGISTGRALEVIKEMGKSGVLFASDIETVTKAAVDLNKYGKVAIEDTVKTFAKLRDDPVKALHEIAKATGMIEPELIALVRTLVSQGKEAEAAGVAMKAYADITSQQIDRMKADYSTLGKFMIDLGHSIIDFFDNTFKAIFRKDTVKQGLIKQIEAINDIINNKAGVVGMVAQLPSIKKGYEEQRAELTKQLVLIDKVAQSEEDRAKSTSEALDISVKAEGYRKKALTEVEKLLENQTRLGNELAKAGTDRDRESILKEMVHVSKEYNEAIDRRIKKESQLSAAQKQHIKDLKVQDDLLAKAVDTNANFREQFDAIFRLYKKSGDVKTYTIAINELVREQKYSKDAAKEQAEAEKELANNKKALLALLDKEQGFTSTYSKQLAILDDMLLTTDMTLEKYNEYLAALNKVQPIFVKHHNAIEQINNSLINSRAIINEEIRDLEFREKILGMSNEDIRQAKIEREKQAKLAKVELELEKQLQAIRKNTIGTSNDVVNAETEAYAQAAEKRKAINREVAINAAEEFVAAFRRIEEGISDAIVTALFEGGKIGRRKLRELLVNELKKPVTTVINVFVKDVISALTGGVNIKGSSSGGFMGGSGGDWGSIGGAFSNVKSIYDIFSGGYEAAIAKAYSSFAMSATGQQLGLSTAVASESGGYTALTGAGQYGATAAQTAGYGIAGYAAYKGLSGGYETNKLIDVIGTFAGLFGPYGVIVSAIAGIINRAFGTKFKDIGVQGTLGGREGFEGEQYKFFKGGFLRDDKTETSDLNDDLEQLIGNQFKEVRASFLGFTHILGINADVIAGYTKEIKFSTKDLDSDPTKAAEQIASRLQEEFEKATEDMAKLALAGTNLRKGNETYVEALSRLANTLKSVNQAMDNLGLTLFETSLSGADAATQFADLFGGLDQASSALQNYYVNFYDQEEKVRNATEGLSAQLKTLGVDVLPDTKEAFRELVQEASAVGNTKLVAQLIGISGAFNQLMIDLGKDRSVQYYINEITKAKRTNEDIAQNIVSMRNETKNLSIELLYATGKIDDANEAAKALALEGLTDAEIALYNFNESLREQIKAAEERVNIENDILQITGNTVELRKRELALLDPTNRALKELFYTLQTAQQLNTAIDTQLPKFLSRDELNEYKFDQFSKKLLDAGILAGISIDDLSERIRVLSRDQIFDAAVEIFNLGHMTDEMRIILVETAGAIADYNDEVARFRIDQSLETINKFVGDLSVIKEPTLTISEAYVKNKGLLDSILDFFGIKGKQTIEDIVGTLLDQAKGLKDFRANLADSIESARMNSMSKPDRIRALKSREAALYEELKTSNDPVSVANRLQSVILQRIQEEADLREEVNNKEKESIEEIQKKKEETLRDELSALERLKNLSNEIAQFTASLRFSDVSPLNYQDQLNVAQSLFQSTLEKAKGGDEDAMSKLIENARAYIDEARSYFASGVDYAAIFNSVTSDLDALGLSGKNVDPQIVALDKQLKEIEKVSRGQENNELAIRETAAAQLLELNKLDAAVAAREDKTRELLIEQRDFLREQVRIGKASLEQWTEIANALLAELATLNGTTTKTLEEVRLENAAP